MPRIIEYIRIERVLTMKRARGLAAVAGTLYFVPENAPFDKKQIKHEKKNRFMIAGIKQICIFVALNSMSGRVVCLGGRGL